MLTTKANARSMAQAKANRDRIVCAVVRRKSKFAAITLDVAKAQGFHIMEIVRPEVDDSVKFCPDCETPNQFGELCNRCIRERDIEDGRKGYL